MTNPKARSFVSLIELVRRVAANFPGNRKDVDRKEALDDILNALKDGSLYAQGISCETTVIGGKSSNRKSPIAEHITPTQWQHFQYRAEENVLHYETSDPTMHSYQAVTVKGIEVDRATVNEVFSKWLNAKNLNSNDV